MARIRSIKPEFWTSAQVLECSTNARLLFVGLWNFCDDCGRHPASPKQVKASVFPADDFSMEQIDGMLQELSKNDLICLYTSGGIEYFYVKGWKHQRIDKPQPAKYPDPFSEHSKNIPVAIPPDRIGEDKKGKDKIESSSSPKNDDGEFIQFWNAYPRRIGKAAALKSYTKAIRSGVSPQKILQAIEGQKCNWNDPKFIPHPATWLNQGRWDDEKIITMAGSSFPIAR